MTEKIKKCFIMMPFTTPEGYQENHFKKVYNQIIKPAVEGAGFEPTRVDENNLSTSIIGKIFEGLINCEMAICDLSSRNPNVLYELGIRQAYNKPVVLIKDDRTERIFDVSGITTLEYSSSRMYEDVIEARNKITQSIKNNAKKSIKVIDVINVTNAKSEQTKSQLSSEDLNEIRYNQISSQLSEIKEIVTKNKISYNVDIYTNLKQELSELYEIFQNRSLSFDELENINERLEVLYRKIETNPLPTNLKNELNNYIRHIRKKIVDYQINLLGVQEK